MKNRSKFILATLFCLFVAIVVWWKLHSAGDVALTHTASSPQPTIPVVTDGKKIRIPPNDSKEAKEMERTNMQNLHEREEATRAAFDAKIDFFGKVVDEHGQPISGANTYYIVSTKDFAGNPTQTGPQTDSEGCFSITGKHGPRLAVMVEHPKYYKTELRPIFFNYANPAQKSSTELPTEDNPAIFVLRSKGKSKSLIHYHSIKTMLPIDGTPVSVDLRNGKVGASSESIILALRSDGNKLPLNQYYPFDWSLKVQVPSGGMQVRTDRFQFMAPSTGYLPEFLYSMTGSSPRSEWKESLENEFFVMFSSGTYARIKLNMLAVKGACKIESFLNPTPGDQNLEYDPTQQVNPH